MDTTQSNGKPEASTRRQVLRAAAAAGASLAWSGQAAAQAWPAKPIRIICAQAAGGGVDATVRSFGEYFSTTLGVPVVIDNRPGAISMIAAEAVARSAPDGYTFLFTLHSQLAQAPVLLKKMPIDPLKDLVPVSAVSSGTGVFAVKKDLPVRNFAEFIAHAKKTPTFLGNFAVGSGWHIQILELAKQTGAQLQAVPYKGTGPMLLDLMGGQIDGAAGSLVGMQPGIQSGAVRPLVIVTRDRTSRLPGVPTWADLGVRVPAFEQLIEMSMFMAPAGTPTPIIDRIAQLTLDSTTKSEKVMALREQFALDDVPVSGTALQKIVAESSPVYRNLTQALGLTAN